MFGGRSDPNLAARRERRRKGINNLQTQLKEYINNVKRLEDPNRTNEKIFEILQMERANQGQYMRQVQRALANIVSASAKNLWAAQNAEKAAAARVEAARKAKQTSNAQKAERKAAVQREMAEIRGLRASANLELLKRNAKNAANLNFLLTKIFKGYTTNANKKTRYLAVRGNKKNANFKLNTTMRGVSRFTGVPIQPKYRFLWTNVAAPPPPPPPGTGQRSVQNKTVNTQNASGQRVSIKVTRNVNNATGIASNWKFGNNPGVNTNKYQINNPGQNNPTISLKP